MIIATNRFPTASALLACWDRPWSGNAKRFAAHRLATMMHLGFDVLEMPTRFPNASAVLDSFERPWSPRAPRED